MLLGIEVAPFIIAFLLVVLGYAVTRWVTNIGESKHWKAIAASLVDNLEYMQREGCAAMGALENIFNGVTADGMPHSKLVRKIADVATDALLLCAPCEHKEDAEDLADIAAFLSEELVAANRNIGNLQEVAQAAEGRAEEAERLLGLVNDRLVVLQSERRDG